jgi:hypothetical protein
LPLLLKLLLRIKGVKIIWVFSSFINLQIDFRTMTCRCTANLDRKMRGRAVLLGEVPLLLLTAGGREEGEEKRT